MQLYRRHPVNDSKFQILYLLERVHADLAVGGHVGVEDLGDEVALGRLCGEALAQDELEAEGAAVVGRVARPVDERLDVADVLLVGDEADAVQVLRRDVGDLFEDALDHVRGDVLRVLRGLVASEKWGKLRPNYRTTELFWGRDENKIPYSKN